MILKSVIIIGIVAIILLIPTDAFSISVSEIEKKLQQAQSEEDIENILMEFTTSPEYMESCSELFEKIKSYEGIIDDPTISDKRKKEIVTTVQNYYLLQCNFTQDIWGDSPKQYSLSQCNELISEFSKWNKKQHEIDKQAIIIFEERGIDASEEFRQSSEWWYSQDNKRDLSSEFRSFCLPTSTDECGEMTKTLREFEQSNSDIAPARNEQHSIEYSLFLQDYNMKNDEIKLQCGFGNGITQYYETQEKYFDMPVPTMVSNSEIQCGEGTIENAFGQCVVDTSNQKSSKGGGCLIATATYGSEMATEVQQLRELRDNQLMNTESGTQFIGAFNDVYYSFSPVIADYERENPLFKEMVKVAITPMISSLSILNYVNMNSESEVLGYGISLILLNLGMYLGVPVVVIVGIRKIK
jgi:hypothetical protein